jgi:hypothetical protein
MTGCALRVAGYKGKALGAGRTVHGDGILSFKLGCELRVAGYKDKALGAGRTVHGNGILSFKLSCELRECTIRAS